MSRTLEVIATRLVEDVLAMRGVSTHQDGPLRVMAVDPANQLPPNRRLLAQQFSFAVPPNATAADVPQLVRKLVPVLRSARHG